ncbi:MAG: FAD-dependent oxidoreductase [Steroidobacteraceae bacterium]
MRNRAARSEVRFRFDTAVEAIDLQGDRVTGVRTSVGTFRADDIVVACGIWGEAVAAFVGFRLPITLVAHPYVYGPVRGRTERKQSFVRWPERHVYARDHGEQLGLGTYDHEPLEVAPADLGRDAEQPWPGAIFDDAVARALDLLPAARRFTPEVRLNGVFIHDARQSAAARARGEYARPLDGRSRVGHTRRRRRPCLGRAYVRSVTDYS